MSKNNNEELKGFKRLISKFKQKGREDSDYRSLDATKSKPASRKLKEQKEIILSASEDLELPIESVSVMEALEDFQERNSLGVADLIRNVSQSLSTSALASLSLSVADSYSESFSQSISAKGFSLRESMSENYSLAVSSSESEFESLSLVDSLSVSEHLTGESLCQDTDAFSLSESIAYSESLSLSESEQASQSVSESEFYSLSQSEWESISESQSSSESEWWSSSESEQASQSVSESEFYSLSQSEWESESQSYSKSEWWNYSESEQASQSVSESEFYSLSQSEWESISESQSISESEWWSFSESEQASQSVSESEFYSLSQSEWESISESHSLSEMISHLLSESESLSLSEILYLSESESLSQSQQISESLSQSQSVADSVSFRKASLSQSYSMLESEFGSYRQSVAETEVFAHDLHASERLYKSLSELDMSPLTHQQKVQEVMTPEISEEGLSQTHIAEEQQELENREESIKNVDLQDSLKHLSHYSESNGTNLRMTERQLYHLLKPGSQPLARDLRNVASELSGLAAITQKREDEKSF